MEDPQQLVVGAIYFTIDYVDEELLVPCVNSYVFIGTGLLDSREPDNHFFQTVDSWAEVGSWATLSADSRKQLGPQAVITCRTKDIGLICNANELIQELIAFGDRAKANKGS